LQSTQHIHAGFADESREANGKPVNDVAAVNSNEVDKRVDKHGEDFGVRIMEHSCEHFSDALQLHRASHTGTAAAHRHITIAILCHSNSFFST